MNTYKLSNGWTAESVMLDLRTGKEIEITNEIKTEITKKMLNAIGYELIEKIRQINE
ncbi:hypothetical protein SH1V18_19180 [Vallitalea longa]|uniref:Uncharacterized protein n=1 Tax=Vallitalea longa TaxID=2936439 RepID=A0A9W5YBQ9_9FIRM|nr:hypothetical protein [Vallitalea longa]GKX29438.1 hypothetical protein SH1V18_19180 [Vallitalea longa]